MWRTKQQVTHNVMTKSWRWSNSFAESLLFFACLADFPNEEVKLDSGSKTEPQSPTSCCQSLFSDLELGEEPGTVLHITVTFPDLKELYFKTQSRVGRHSRQRVVKGKIKVCVATGGHQVQTIEVYVERTPDAAHLVGDRCGRVYLKAQPGAYFSSKVKKNSVTWESWLREQTPGSVYMVPRVMICSS